MSRSRICFLEGLPTITSIVEGFGGMPSYNTQKKKIILHLRLIFVFIIIKVYSINLIQ